MESDVSTVQLVSMRSRGHNVHLFRALARNGIQRPILDERVAGDRDRLLQPEAGKRAVFTSDDAHRRRSKPDNHALPWRLCGQSWHCTLHRSAHVRLESQRLHVVALESSTRTHADTGQIFVVANRTRIGRMT